MTTTDRATIARKLGYLQKNLELLESYRDLTEKTFLSNHEKRFSSERLLQTAIESVTDCARLLVLLENWRKLRDERDAVLILVERRVIPKTLCAKLLRAKSFRNILVHEYVEIDPRLVYRHLKKDCDDLRKFARSLARYLHAPRP